MDGQASSIHWLLLPLKLLLPLVLLRLPRLPWVWQLLLRGDTHCRKPGMLPPPLRGVPWRSASIRDPGAGAAVAAWGRGEVAGWPIPRIWSQE